MTPFRGEGLRSKSSQKRTRRLSTLCGEQDGTALDGDVVIVALERARIGGNVGFQAFNYIRACARRNR